MASQMIKGTIAALAAGLAIACGGGNKSGGGGGGGGGGEHQATAGTEGPRGTASITGQVKFTGTPPVNAPIDMSEEAKCKADYTTPPREQNVVVNSNHTLDWVFVYVKSGLPAGAKYSAPSTAVVLDQKGCRYHPHVFGIMAGQPLDIRNSDPLLHNIKAMAKKNRPFNISQPAAGMNSDRTFTEPEVMLPFECNVHGWMHAYAGVMTNPFYSTSDSTGTFTIDSLPAGTYTVEAWHQQYGTKDTRVTLQNGERKTVDFSFTAH